MKRAVLFPLVWCLWTHASQGEVITGFIAEATQKNPRNTEGDILVLKNGTLLGVWSEFYGGNRDESSARIAASVSRDGGRTWAPRYTLQENIGKQNVMSATLLRSRGSGEILFFFLVKDSEEELYPMVRRSGDEGKTWTEPLRLHRDPGYYVMNNARAIQLKSGRILCPVSFTSRVFATGHEFRNVVYYSDDDGRTFRRSPSILTAPKRGAMEPGLIEMADGRVLQIIRTQVGQVWHSISSDGGVTWPAAAPWTVAAPESPSTIFRLPPAKSGTPGELVIVYNPSVKLGSNHSGPRTPLAASLSRDEGKTWSAPKILESDPAATYAYTSATLHGDRVLLTYYYGRNKLYSQRFKSLPVSWFREP